MPAPPHRKPVPRPVIVVFAYPTGAVTARAGRHGSRFSADGFAILIVTSVPLSALLLQGDADAVTTLIEPSLFTRLTRRLAQVAMGARSSRGPLQFSH
jgi:hypothetical protein